MNKYYRLLSIILLAGLVLVGCKKDKKTTVNSNELKHLNYTVSKLQAAITPLYFSGVINPIRVVPVLSPDNGRIVKIYFSYGGNVKAKQDLLEINSDKLAQDYRTTINDYLSKKTAFSTAKREFEVTKQLYKAKVSSRDDYINSQNTYRNSILAYYQKKYQLAKILAKARVEPDLVEGLTINDTDKINKILGRSFHNIKVLSSASGIALFPTSSGSDANDNAGNPSSKGKIKLGQAVKEGQILLTIGDLSGLASTIQVGEININRIHKGMNVTITGDAFPGITLKGKITLVS
nr:efflux RND transporter periplasmic adaptor subunit [Gammaproteobacteria bacterium]